MQNWRKNILNKYKVKVNSRAIHELDRIFIPVFSRRYPCYLFKLSGEVAWIIKATVKPCLADGQVRGHQQMCGCGNSAPEKVLHGRDMEDTGKSALTFPDTDTGVICQLRNRYLFHVMFLQP